MDDDNPDPAHHDGSAHANETPDQGSGQLAALEGFLTRLFSDRHLSSNSPAQPPPPRAVNLAANIPFFGAESAIPPPQVWSSSNAPMGTPPEAVFCVEDTVGLKDNRFSVGVVDRSFGDVDSHAPRPQRDYGENIERHPDVPRDDFTKFMRTGIPPRGAVLVSWQTQLKTELIPEAKLQLLDRALYVGDVVKKNTKEPMSGTVIGTKAACTLFPAAMFNGGQLTPAMTEDLSIRNVPAEELINVFEVTEAALVIYDDWIGRVEEVFDEVTVKLSNNSVVVVEDPEDLENDDAMLERISVGDTVNTKKGNLRRGRWRYGAFDPNVRPQGMVVETRPEFIHVHWLTRRIDGKSDGPLGNEPPARLFRDELESSNFHVYDASPSAAVALPLSPGGTSLSYHIVDVAVGDRVRFKDLAGAAVKYDGTKTLPNGYPQGRLTRIPRAETLGYDMNVFVVMQTHTQVTVQWQDLSVTQHMGPFLIPDPVVEDDDEVWPGEIVCTKEPREKASGDASWTFRPAKVGIVQAVNSRDRIASVRWFGNPDIQFMDEHLIPPSTTGKLLEDSQDVSLYDIKTTPSLNRRRGDFVLVHPDSVDPHGLPHDLQGPSWLGEVIDLGLDGYITVRLGAAKPVVDVRIPVEKLTLAYSSDMDEQFFNTPTMDGESVDEEDDISDFDSASFNDMWIEYEGMEGEPIEGVNEEEWSTEDEENDDDNEDDESMQDIIPSDDALTSNTTPEALPEPERKPTLAAKSRTDTVHVRNGHTTVSLPEDTDMASEKTTNAPSAGSPSPFLVLDDSPPADHHFLDHTAASSSYFMRRIAKEHKILRSSLPPDIYVRTWESRLDLIRILMIGPSETPYEFAPFVIDFHLGSSYPQQPPSAFFHSWTYGNGPVNPNLYEDGKICLSLLGTWHADERNESWSPSKSTLLQLLVSIMGLVLVKEPYYNEAGYDVHREAPETKLSSALYTERAYFRARAFIVHALTTGITPFANELKYLYRDRGEGAPKLLEKAIEASKQILERSGTGSEDHERDGLRRISLGATVMLKRQVERLEEIWRTPL